MFRLLIQTLSIFAGGALSSNGYSIKLIYFMLFFAPLIMFIYTLFIFKEAKKSKIWKGCSHICKALGEFSKLITNVALLLPLLYSVILLAVPSLSDVCTFILLNKGGWNLEQVSLITLSTGIIFSFFMIWFLATCMPKM